jgi:hypothetical protein
MSDSNCIILRDVTGTMDDFRRFVLWKGIQVCKDPREKRQKIVEEKLHSAMRCGAADHGESAKDIFVTSHAVMFVFQIEILQSLICHLLFAPPLLASYTLTLIYCSSTI